MDFLDDVNWPAFLILTIVGLFTVTIMLVAWKQMHFLVSWYVKIAMYSVCPVGAFFFTKLWFE